jgi:hypothetical protein
VRDQVGEGQATCGVVRGVSSRCGERRWAGHQVERTSLANASRVESYDRRVSRWLRITLGVVAFVVALAIVFALSLVVGYVGSPDTTFDWALASVFGTAAGTTLLALATAVLASFTWSEVRTTQALAEASDRPFVVLQGTPCSTVRLALVESRSACSTLGQDLQLAYASRRPTWASASQALSQASCP